MFLDLFIRFSGVAILLGIATLVIRDVRATLCARYLIGICFCVSVTLLSYTPDIIRLPDPLYLIARFLDIPSLVFVWLFGLALFDDDFRPKWPHYLAGGLYVGLVVLLRLQQFEFALIEFPGLLLPINALALILIGHLLTVTLQGRTDDLLEARRRGRFYFTIGLALTAAIYALSDILLSSTYARYLPSIKAAILMPGIIWTALWLFQIPADKLFFGKTYKQPTKPLSLREQQLVDKLQKIMLRDKAYLNAGITIDDISKRIGTSSHTLRALINGHFGHRNFSEYINLMRIGYAKEELMRPEKSDMPILTIAMDAGFNSISAFNRAFKQFENMTPSEFRRLDR
ncbi:MAG: AraC family transcriptional regulator [Hellea sp.]